MNRKQPLLTIGEIAKMIGITRRIIINYEDHGLIQADTRGEFDSGYRYYSMDTLVRIRTIRSLQNIGLSLEEIKGYLNGSTSLEPALKRMEAMRDELDANILLLRERIHKHEIHISQLPHHTVYRKTTQNASLEEHIKNLRDVAFAAISSYGTDISKRMYFTESSLQNPAQITYCAAVPDGCSGEGVILLPPAQALVKYHYGSYETVHQTRQELLDYAAEQGIALTGTFRQIYLEGPPQHKDPGKFITIVAFLMET